MYSGLATTDAWRPWFVDGKSSSERQNAGNVWKMDGLTFITFRNAGHMGKDLLVIIISKIVPTD